ncbi:MAG: MerR family transcriptional regulator [Byssovorax sp.]
MPRLPTPPSPPGERYTIDQIARATGVTPRTVRHWTARGLLEPPPFQAAATRYGQGHLARIHAIQQLREQGLRLDAIRARLEAPPAPTAATPARPPPPKYPAERWERIVLVPGVELHVNAAGGPMLRRMAEEIFAAYGPAKVEEES